MSLIKRTKSDSFESRCKLIQIKCYSFCFEIWLKKFRQMDSTECTLHMWIASAWERDKQHALCEWLGLNLRNGTRRASVKLVNLEFLNWQFQILEDSISILEDLEVKKCLQNTRKHSTKRLLRTSFRRFFAASSLGGNLLGPKINKKINKKQR